MVEKDSLKDFMTQNLDLLPQEELLEGDVDRFETAYGEDGVRKIKFSRGISRRKNSFWRAVVIPVAASLFVILCSNLLIKTLSDYQTPSQSGVDVYISHYDKVGKLVGEISKLTALMSKDECKMYEAVVDEVIYESVSILELIPEYLPESDKAKIINEYSVAVCSSLQDIINSINN